jgi:hypothetical protein
MQLTILMENFFGNMEPGEIYGSYIVQFNTRLRREAFAFASEHGGAVIGYLHGKYKRGWVVLDRHDANSTTGQQS